MIFILCRVEYEILANLSPSSVLNIKNRNVKPMILVSYKNSYQYFLDQYLKLNHIFNPHVKSIK
jgi:hypothetical protein